VLFRGPFEITADRLAQLSPDLAVDLVRDILWAEAGRQGISKTLVNVPSWITVADGGVDAEITAVPAGISSNIFYQGTTRYQVKTGPFSLSSASNIRAVLCKPPQSGRPRELNTRVKSCFDNNGTLVVITFGWDGPEQRDDDLLERFRNELKSIDSRYALASIEFWRQNQILGLLADFPSLRLGLIGGNIGPFSTHQSWSSNLDMTGIWSIGAEQQRFVEALRAAVRSDSVGHVRIISEPGLGKTRATLEALREPDLFPLVLYCPSPKGVLDSDFVGRLTLPDSQLSALFVFDECGSRDKANILNRLGSLAPRVKLITIDSEFDPSLGGEGFLSLQPLGDAQVSDIICSYGNPKEEVSRWIPFCSGSPRVAHVLGRNLLNNPEDLTRPLQHVLVWDRYIAGIDDFNSDTYNRRRRVLLWLSLFKRFGYEDPFNGEARAIARKIQHEEGIGWREFQTIVQELRRRRILQGDQTLYITPRLLHIWLWNQWWDTYASDGSFSLEEFRRIDPTSPDPELLPENLMRWMEEMFRYADASGANEVAERMLGPTGPFSFDYLNSKEGSDFFLRLTEASPRAALRLLQRTIGDLDVDVLRNLHGGRRSCVNALEMIVIWRDLFHGGAQLLLMLAEAENESWANNASGVFEGLFVAAPGAGAPTEAPPDERLPMLKEALYATTPERRSLGLRAARAALSTGPFTRLAGPERQGLRPAPALWKPSTYGEWFDAYRSVWRLLLDRISSIGEEERQGVADVLIESARGLAANANLAEMVISGIDYLLSTDLVHRKKLIAMIEEILHFDRKRLPEQATVLWEALRSKLLGDSFHERLERYAGMQLLTDRFDENNNHVDKALPRLIELANESIAEPDLLDPELAWLVTPEAVNGYAFGRELAAHDLGFALLPKLLDAQRYTDVPSAFFLAGYFSSIKEQNSDDWEELLDSLAEDPSLRPVVAELTWRSGGLSDRAARRILNLAEGGFLDPAAFRLFHLGSTTSTVSEPTLLSWIAFLCREGSGSALIAALELIESYYGRACGNSRLPVQEVSALLLHSGFFASGQGLDTMGRFYWTALAKRFLNENPAQIQPVISAILQSLGGNGGVAGGYFPESLSVVTQAALLAPELVWGLVTQHLGPPIDARAMAVREWLRQLDPIQEGSGGGLEFFPSELIWNWVDEDVDSRAPYIADLVPKYLFRDANRPCLAREVLARYGERQDVRNEMLSNIGSGQWTGPASTHFASVAAQLSDFRRGETDQKVIAWLDDAISYLEAEVRQFRGLEERGEF